MRIYAYSGPISCLNSQVSRKPVVSYRFSLKTLNTCFKLDPVVSTEELRDGLSAQRNWGRGCQHRGTEGGVVSTEELREGLSAQRNWGRGCQHRGTEGEVVSTEELREGLSAQKTWGRGCQHRGTEGGVVSTEELREGLSDDAPITVNHIEVWDQFNTEQ